MGDITLQGKLSDLFQRAEMDKKYKCSHIVHYHYVLFQNCEMPSMEILYDPAESLQNDVSTLHVSLI